MRDTCCGKPLTTPHCPECGAPREELWPVQRFDGRYFGYARKSTDERNVASLDMQEEMARRRCEAAGGEWVRCYREIKSAVRVPWNERTELVAALNHLERDDHLVV